jgi:hypothetical protein
LKRTTTANGNTAGKIGAADTVGLGVGETAGDAVGDGAAVAQGVGVIAIEGRRDGVATELPHPATTTVRAAHAMA